MKDYLYIDEYRYLFTLQHTAMHTEIGQQSPGAPLTHTQRKTNNVHNVDEHKSTDVIDRRKVIT